MGLTHVCIWKDENWKRISAYEASKLYPYGRPARSQTFVCELCNQYVTLTRENIKPAYFRHNSTEENKECEDRSIIYSSSYKKSGAVSGLPLKLLVNKNRISFHIGLTPLPNYISQNNDYKITIKGVEEYTYNYSRLDEFSLTYLDVGSRPCSKYSIVISPEINGLNKFWPNEISGVDSKGSLFDKKTGKKLPYDADVQVKKEYYLITRYFYYSKYDGVVLNTLFSLKNGWKVCVVKANEYSESAAKFFLKYHCRLTHNPVNIYPLWPDYIETPYILYSDSDRLYFAVSGRYDELEP